MQYNELHSIHIALGRVIGVLVIGIGDLKYRGGCVLVTHNAILYEGLEHSYHLGPVGGLRTNIL